MVHAKRPKPRMANVAAKGGRSAIKAREMTPTEIIRSGRRFV
jgi:hypothetical protein